MKYNSIACINHKMLRQNIILTIVSTLLVSNSNALKIEIKQGEVNPEPITVSTFNGTNGKQISDIIKNDLELSSLFIIVSISDKDINNVNLQDLQDQGSRFLLHGKIIENKKVNFTLLDIITGKTLYKDKIININSSNIRETAHIIADSVYERITNELGYFNTKIVYVKTVKSYPRTTQLIIMDQDGVNNKQLTNGKDLVLSPRFSPDGKTIAYIAYTNDMKGVSNKDKSKQALIKSAHVYVSRIGSNTRSRLLNNNIMQELIRKNHGNPISMTYAPRFSPDGQSVVFAIIINGTSAIYKYNMADDRLIQLTKHENIDTSPCYSPDGKRIVFTSNREGTEALYVMSVDGSDQHKISQEGGKYSQPVWSPRGDLIAFTKQIKNIFYIGVVKPDGSGERLIASHYLVEAPVWSSNGRYIVCTYQASSGENSKILFTDVTGKYSRIIETSGDASSPAWSPTIHNK